MTGNRWQGGGGGGGGGGGVGGGGGGGGWKKEEDRTRRDWRSREEDEEFIEGTISNFVCSNICSSTNLHVSKTVLF